MQEPPNPWQVAAWMDQVIIAAVRQDDEVIDNVAAQVRDVLADFPMPGWDGPA